MFYLLTSVLLSLGLSGLLSAESLDGAETGLRGKDSKVDGNLWDLQRQLGVAFLAPLLVTCRPGTFQELRWYPWLRRPPYYTVINFNFGALSHPSPMKTRRQEMYYHYFIHFQRVSHLLDHVFSPRNPVFGGCGVWYVGRPMKRKNTRDSQPGTCNAVPPAVLHFWTETQSWRLPVSAEESQEWSLKMHPYVHDLVTCE